MACLTLAILSTLILNIVSSYSYSKVNSNAEPVGNPSVLANDSTCNPTNTNAAACISLSITSSSSSSTGGNDPNLSLSIPQGGGIATGRHTVIVSTGSSVIGYELQLSSNGDETGLVNNEDDNVKTNTIPTTTGTITSPSQLADRTYGYTLANLDNNNNLANTNIWIGLKPNTDPDTITTVDESNLTIGQANTTSHNIYYGVNIQNPVETRAGDYTRQVVYTVVGELMLEPVVEDLVLNSSYIPYTSVSFPNLGDAPDDAAYGTTSILTGSNLSSITNAWVDINDNGIMDGGEGVTSLTHATGDEANTKLTFEAPEAPRQSINGQFPEGAHDVYLEWSGGEPVKIENGWNYIRQSECVTTTSLMDSRQSDCIVDIDDNMIPVYYSGDESNAGWSVVADCSDVENSRQCNGNRWLYVDEVIKWYDYTASQWANAVTLRDDFEAGCYTVEQYGDELYIDRIDKKETCNSTQGASSPLQAAKAVGKFLGWYGSPYAYGAGAGQGPHIRYNDEFIYSLPLHPDDILGYWVYIPRYSYEVMRRDAIDLVQQPEDFKIKFETADTTKKVPVEGCSDTNNPKSYRVGCSLNRTYTNTATNTETNEVTNTTWATHPAFTWMDQDGNPVELNGIWVGKFETTGSTEEPTVLPNEKHMSLVSGNIGDMYDVAKSMGIEDKNNKYGNTTETNLPNQNNNNLVSSPSHMLKNSEWGAVTYLSASRYGAGVNKVQLNGNYASGSDDNGDSSYGVTGCGPQANGDENDYDTSGTLGTSTACGSADKAYNGTLGQYASTTNNVYGVYDMSGGAHERVMGSYATDNSSQSSTSHFTNATKPPYVDLYNITSNNDCTWNTNGSACGGHALFETASWGGDRSYFVFSFVPWFLRGGYADDGSAGVFASSNTNGYSGDGFRVALIAN